MESKKKHISFDIHVQIPEQNDEDKPNRNKRWIWTHNTDLKLMGFTRRLFLPVLSKYQGGPKLPSTSFTFNKLMDQSKYSGKPQAQMTKQYSAQW